jgi:putative membrane protein
MAQAARSRVLYDGGLAHFPKKEVLAMQFIIRLIVTAIALWVAVELIPGIGYQGAWWGLLLVALVFGVINALVRPVLVILSFPLIVLTLGLFIFILNAFLLWITGQVSGALGLDFTVTGFWAAVVGGVIVGVVSTVLNLLVGSKPKRRKRRAF